MGAIAGLSVPELPLVAARRAEPHLIGAPLAVVERTASAERGRAAAQAAREAAAAVSPRVEEAAPGLLSLDVSGLESLVGDERAVARQLVSAAERVGLRAAVGLAASKSVAR